MPKSIFPILAALGAADASKHLAHRNKLQVLDSLFTSYNEQTEEDGSFHSEYTWTWSNTPSE